MSSTGELRLFLYFVCSIVYYTMGFGIPLIQEVPLFDSEWVCVYAWQYNTSTYVKNIQK